MIIERIGKDSYQLGESPIWDPRHGLLYFVDSLAGCGLVPRPEKQQHQTLGRELRLPGLAGSARWRRRNPCYG